MCGMCHCYTGHRMGWEMDSLTGLCKLSIFVNYPRFYIYSKLLHKMLVYFVIPSASGLIKIK